MKKIFIVGLVLIVSCIKDYNSSTKSYIDNKTSHNITIAPYYNGYIDSSLFRIILPFENKLVYEKNPRGKTLSPDYATILQPYDSVVVTFDGIYKTTHLKFNSEIMCTDCIVFNSNRSISNNDNYIKTITEETKHYQIGYFTYTFSEQDYIDAAK